MVIIITQYRNFFERQFCQFFPLKRDEYWHMPKNSFAFFPKKPGTYSRIDI